MTRNLHRSLLPAVLLAALSWTACSDELTGPGAAPGDFAPRFATAPTVTSMENLGTVSTTHDASEAVDVNDAGVVIGSSTQGCCRGGPFIVPAGGTMEALSATAGIRVSIAINNTGQIVGLGSGVSFPRLWNGSGTPTDLSNGTGGTPVALGLSENGFVSGYISGDLPEASRWRGASWVDLNFSGVANDVNDREFLVGQRPDGSGADMAYLWQGFSPDLLGTLGGAESEALALNETAQIVGWAHNGAGSKRPFIGRGLDPLTDLGTLGGAEGVARDINEAGYAAGESQDASGVKRATLWTPDGQIADLGSVGGAGAESWANAINNVSNNSVVVVGASMVNGQRRATRWVVDVGAGGGGCASECGGDVSEILDGLEAAVQDLVDSGALSSGKAKPLFKKLDQARKKIAKNKPAKAIKKLNSFIKKVNKYVNKGRLTPEEAKPLLDGAQAAIDLLST